MTEQSADSRIHRRAFQSSLTAIGFAGVCSELAHAEKSEDSNIRLAVIGLGSRGFNLLDDFLQQPNCSIVALCDVDERHYRDQPWGEGKQYGLLAAESHVQRRGGQLAAASREVVLESDFQKIVDRPDVDAVVVATPDHWHAVCTLKALERGKDVYCEKPVTHLFAEGQQVVAKVQETGAVFQTGSQQRSAAEFQRIVMLSRNGVLGKIRRVEVGLPPGYARPMGSTEVVLPRKTLNYDFWCGPSPRLPLMQARHHRWWRGHRAYGGGVLMDWIGHHNDIAHWAIGEERNGPVRVEARDWTFPDTDIYNSPHHYSIHSEFQSGVQVVISSRLTPGLKVIGSRGWAFANRGKLTASNDQWTSSSFLPGDWRIGTDESHVANFLRCIRERQECIAPAEIAHRSITPGHLGYVSQAVGRSLEWDPKLEVVLNDDEADTILKTVDYRRPWKQIAAND